MDVWGSVDVYTGRGPKTQIHCRSVYVYRGTIPRPGYTVDQCTHIQEHDPRPGYTVDQCKTIREQDPRPRCTSIPVPECTVILWTYLFMFTDVTCLECEQYVHRELIDILHCTLLFLNSTHLYNVD